MNDDKEPIINITFWIENEIEIFNYFTHNQPFLQKGDIVRLVNYITSNTTDLNGYYIIKKINYGFEKHLNISPVISIEYFVKAFKEYDY